MLTTLVVASLALATQAPAPAAARSPQLDSLDAYIQAQLAMRKVPGLSLAIVDHGRVVYARGYGVTAPGGTEPVTTDTRFLAGSISKSVAATGALALVEAGTISLDGNVNQWLTSWKVPENAFTAAEPVTPRRILSHTAGLTVHGFGGYQVGTPVPTTLQILDGVPPANSPPIRVDTTPGAIWRYSGGGYTVMQLLMEDVTGAPFSDWMAAHVLSPLGMTRSSFRQPPPDDFLALTSAGQYAPGRPVPGRWHLYPEMAAAGLWTTASDLARFIIGVQESYTGTATPVLSQAMTRTMLTEVRGDYGLGVGLDSSSGALLFSHGGRDDGFDAYMGGYATTGQGIVLMINANDNSGMLRRILEQVARAYDWPGSAPPYALTPMAIPELRLASYGGRYEVANNQMLTLVPEGQTIVSLLDGLPDRVFLPTGPWQVTSDDRTRQFTFEHSARGILGFTRPVGGEPALAPKIGPLLRGMKPAPDPDPARTVRAESALRALAAGGAAVQESPALTASAKADFGRPQGVLSGFSGLTFLMAEDVAGRGIERHGSAVVTVLSYRLDGSTQGAYVLVYLAADGLVTDYDVVDN
ncbi:MAG TPA: serine hydrolase domain-containing protein [Gemmatimonadales bacterium]|nr:serine hydrolase domain-containing protein [Gemmatimonadales bacterium]